MTAGAGGGRTSPAPTREPPSPVVPVDERLTDGLLTDREREVRSRVRHVVAAHVAPAAARLDRTAAFAGDGYRAVAAAGLGGLLFPPELGGSGDSTVAYAIAVEEITRACPATSLVYMTQTHAAYPIMLAGTPAQQSRYVPGLCSGELYGSLAITEPEAGSDAAALRTRARRTDEGYVLDGAKTFITTGDRADVLVCFATTDPAEGRAGISAFLVPGDVPGLARGRVLEKLGMHGSSTAELSLAGIRLGPGALLGEEGGAWALSMRSVVKSRISAAAQGVGVATAAYEVGLRWAAGRGLLHGAAHQGVQFTLADLRTRIVAARLLLHTVARVADTHTADLTTEVSMAKTTCTDLGFAAANQVVELMGAEGDLTDLGAERLLRDVKVTQIYDGTNEIQRLLIARDTVGRLVGP